MPAFQYNVGTDYMSYVDMYKYGYNIEYYFNKKELIFYSILKIATGLKLGEQSIFILVSIVYSIFWAYFVCLLKSSNYKVW
ncbi:EpsG family protein, partial [Vibrio parahaemolyticus]